MAQLKLAAGGLAATDTYCFQRSADAVNAAVASDYRSSFGGTWRQLI
jgi:hypothetical protein